MKQITLNIPEAKYSFILELLQSIPYLQLEKKDDSEIPEFHKKIINERIKNSNNKDFIDWDKADFNLNP